MNYHGYYMSNPVDNIYDKILLDGRGRKIVRDLLDRLDNLRKEPSDVLRRRWVWELMQNAQDTVGPNQQVSVMIDLKKNGSSGELRFGHNGRPFQDRELAYLIDMISTKDREKDAIVQTTGRFGTGFITTHLLSERVTITGFLNDSNKLKLLSLHLDRTAKDEAGMSASIELSHEQVRKSTNGAPISDDSGPIWTYFNYELNESGIKTAEMGLDDLRVSIAFVMAFCPRIESVTLEHEGVKISRVSRQSVPGAIIMEIELPATWKSSARTIMLIDKEKFSVAFPVSKSSAKHGWSLEPIPTSMPRCFCSFPLIGSEKFPLPAIVNSHVFHLDEKRSHIYLGLSTDPDVMENKGLVVNILRDMRAIAAGCADGKIGQTHYLADVPDASSMPNLDVTWFNGKFSDYQSFLFGQNIVQLEGGEWTSVTGPEGKKPIRIPHAPDLESRDRLWSLMHRLDPKRVPSRISSEFWTYCSVVKRHYWTLERLLCKATAAGKHGQLPVYSVRQLSGEVKLSEADAIAWLDHIIDLVVKCKHADWLNLVKNPSTGNIQNSYVIPNQFGELCQLKHIKRDDGIPEPLKDIALKLGVNVRRHLVHLDCGVNVPDMQVMHPRDVAKLIYDAVEKVRLKSSKTDLERAAFKELYLWIFENDQRARELFVEIYDRRHILRSDEENAASIRLADVANKNGINTPEQLSAALNLAMALKARGVEDVHEFLAKREQANADATSPEEKQDQSVLQLLRKCGVKTALELKSLLESQPDLFRHIPVPTIERFLRFLKILDRARNRVKLHLQDLDYDCAAWEPTYPPSVIGGVKRDGRDIPLVVRPSDDGFVVIFYDEEPQTLLKPGAEFWCDDGINSPIMVSVGKVVGAMKKRSLNKIWLE